MEFVLTVHSIVRWLSVLLAAVVLIKSLIGWLGKQAYTPMDRGLMTGFAGLISVQLILGIILLFNAGLGRTQLEHAFSMFIAIALAHTAPRLRRRAADDATRFRNQALLIIVVLLLIVVGVASLPGGWAR